MPVFRVPNTTPSEPPPLSDEEIQRKMDAASKQDGAEVKMLTPKKPKKKPVKKNMGGMMNYSHGGKIRGYGMAKGGRPCKMVSMKGS